MRGEKKHEGEGPKVTFEAIVERQGGRGLFGIEQEAEEIARLV